MQFNSYLFVFLFLPVVLIGYYVLNKHKNRNLSNVFLIISSLVFYGYAEIRNLIYIICSVIINYCCAIWIERKKEIGKRVLIFGVATNIVALVLFKYYNFIVGNINSVFDTELKVLTVIIPLGISFITFSQIGFLVEEYRSSKENDSGGISFIDYACWVTFFPKIIEGPISRYSEFEKQLKNESTKFFNSKNFSGGLYLFAIGMAKKVLVADNFISSVNYGYQNTDNLNSLNAILLMLMYTLQLYFDFSGYCDMALGIGKMMNIDLPVNFSAPYRSCSIQEFWKRWHITLTAFLTANLYIPLGGNRKGKIRTYANILIVFTISGLWHGANWTFVIWGLLHGIASVLNRIFNKQYQKLPNALKWFLTFTFVNVSWIFFRAETLSDALQIIRKIFEFTFSGFDIKMFEGMVMIEFDAITRILLGVPLINIIVPFSILFITVALCFSLKKKTAYEVIIDFKPNVLRLAISVFLMVWCVLSFSSISEFIYAGF